jgi:hypothetical protein
MKKTILILLVVVALICSCKKYEEGPCISFRSAKSRVLGYHTLTKFTVNGIDSLQAMNDKFGLVFHFWHNVIKSQDIDELRLHIVYNVGDTYPNNFSCNFYLGDRNKEIILDYGADLLCNNCDRGFGDVHFKIIKLKNDDIHLKTTLNSIEYYLELE